jgi:hypothetical protein
MYYFIIRLAKNQNSHGKVFIGQESKYFFTKFLEGGNNDVKNDFIYMLFL